MYDNIGTCLIAAATAIPAYYLIGRWAQGGQFKKDDIRIDDKVVLITGANTGIGKETALELAKRGAKVYIASRDTARSESVCAEIITKTGNKNVFAKTLDLASFDSIRRFAEDFQKIEKKLHILINNAAVLAIPNRQTTKDGLEMQIGTNYFGPFLLTNLLLDTIKRSAPARIINVSSIAHKYGVINRDDLQCEIRYNKWTAYFQSKLADVLFSRELSKRLQGTGVTVNSLHPGAVQTELLRNLSPLHYLAMPINVFFKTPKSGAQTSIMLAVDPNLVHVTGKYFSDCKIVDEVEAAKNDETAQWLWTTSEQITHLKKK